MTAMIDDSALPAPAQPAPLPVTIRPAPRREPPFDDEPTTQHLTSAAEQMLPFDPWPGRLSRPRSWSDPRPSARDELPDPHLWARRLLVAVLEARAGRRPMRQIADHLSPSILAGIAAAVEGGRWHAARPGIIRTLRVCEPADGVAEIAAVVDHGARCQAIAARLEGFDGRWLCVRLQIG